MLNVQTNTTQTLAGPSTKDAGATYFAGITSLIQLDSTGVASYLPFSPNDSSANAAAEWSKVVSLANLPLPTSGQAAGTSSGTVSAAMQSASLKPQTNASNGSNDAVAVVAPAGLLGGFVSAAMLACAAVLF